MPRKSNQAAGITDEKNRPPSPQPQKAMSIGGGANEKDLKTPSTQPSNAVSSHKAEPTEHMIDVFVFDSESKRVVLDSKCQPATVRVKGEPDAQYWLYARNNKYEEEKIDHNKVGKWMLFYPSDQINEIWEKVKLGIRNGDLWHAKVSFPNPGYNTQAIMIYTKDYTDIADVTRVLNYLISSGLKPAGRKILYKTDAQTRAGIYRGGKERHWLYDSDSLCAQRDHKLHSSHPPQRSDVSFWRASTKTTTNNTKQSGHTTHPRRTNQPLQRSDALSWRRELVKTSGTKQAENMAEHQNHNRRNPPIRMTPT
jgi:hypothetical protein